MNYKKRLLSCTAILLSMAMTAEVFAAPPAVTYDETLYVNMDSYGSPTKTSIVKNKNHFIFLLPQSSFILPFS